MQNFSTLMAVLVDLSSLVRLSSLIGEPVIRIGSVAKLVQAGIAGKIDHWRRAAHQHQGLVCSWEKVLAYHLIVDKS